MAIDFIKRSDALAVIETANSMAGSFLEATMKLCMTMNNIAAVDAVPVVRCKYCVHYDAGENDCESWSYCKILARDVPENWFCGDGKMKMRG